MSDQNLAELLADYLSEGEVAEAIEKTTKTLRNWRAQRVGPPWVRLGRQVYYRKAAFGEWLRDCEQQPVRRRREKAAA